MARVHLIGARAQAQHYEGTEPWCYETDDEVWGLNGIWLKCCEHYWTRFFNLHTHKNLKRYNYKIERDASWVKLNPDVLFYSVDEWPELKGAPNAHIFPRGVIAERLTRHRNDYHCGSFDWMLAFAMTCSRPLFHEIILHGVSLLIEPGEPPSARACLEYWIGVAEARGTKVICAPDCDLFAFIHMVKSNLVYGYDDTPMYEDRTRDLKGEPPYKIAERANG
jgi:hypothetical protein